MTNFYITVGPSGAGKTTFLDQHLADIYRVSSDDMRFYLTGSFTDQSQNNRVFSACHDVIRALLKNGVSVVFDATNIKNQDRVKVVELAPEGVEVIYILVDRSLDEKFETKDWRPGWLIEKHHNTFQSNLPSILDTDGFDHVTVWDLREK